MSNDRCAQHTINHSFQQWNHAKVPHENSPPISAHHSSHPAKSPRLPNGSSLKRIQKALGALYLQKILQIISADSHLFEDSYQSTRLYSSSWNG